MAKKNNTTNQTNTIGNSIPVRGKANTPSGENKKDDGQLTLVQSAVCSMLGQLIVNRTSPILKASDALNLIKSKDSLFTYIQQMKNVLCGKDGNKYAYVFDDKGLKTHIKETIKSMSAIHRKINDVKSELYKNLNISLKPFYDDIIRINEATFDELKDTNDILNTIIKNNKSNESSTKPVNNDLKLTGIDKLLMSVQSIEKKMSLINNDNKSLGTIDVNIIGKNVEINELIKFLSSLNSDIKVSSDLKNNIGKIIDVINGNDNSLNKLFESFNNLNNIEDKDINKTILSLNSIVTFINDLKISDPKNIKTNLNNLKDIINKSLNGVIIAIKTQASQINNETNDSIKAISSFLSSITGLVQNKDNMKNLEKCLNIIQDNLDLLVGDEDSLINTINSIKVESSVVDSLKNLQNVFKEYNKLIDMVPTMKSSLGAMMRILLVEANISLLRDTVKDINKVVKYRDTLDNLNLMFNTYNKVIKSMPSYKNILSGILKLSLLIGHSDLLNKFGKSINQLRIGDKREEQFERLKTIINSYTNIIDNFPDVDEITDAHKKSVLLGQSVIETSNIVKPMQELINNLEGLDFSKLNKKDFTEFSDCINTLSLLNPKSIKRMLKSIDMINKALAVNVGLGKAIDLGMKMLIKEGESIKKFIDTLNNIDKNDIETSMKVMTSVIEMVYLSGAILLLGGFVMSKVDPMSVLEFGILTLGFVYGMVSVAKFLSKSKIDSDCVNSIIEFGKFVVLCGSILLIGGLVMSIIDPKNLILFTITLGAFIIAMSIPILALKWIDNSNAFEGLENFALLIAVSGAIMVFGGLLMNFINPVGLLMFTAMLGVFVWGMSIVASNISKDFGNADMKSLHDFGIYIALCGATLVLGSLITSIVSFTDILTFMVMLGAFVTGMTIVASIASQMIEGDALKGMEGFGVMVALSGLTLILGALFMKIPGIVENVILFGVILSVFVIAISGAYRLAASGKKQLKDAKQFAHLVMMSGMILLIGAAFMYIDEFVTNVLLFGVLLSAFIIGISYAYKIASSGMKKSWSGAIVLLGLVVLSTVVLLVGANFIEEHGVVNVALFGICLAGFILGYAFIIKYINEHLDVGKDIIPAILAIGGLILLTFALAAVFQYISYISDNIQDFGKFIDTIAAMGLSLLGMGVLVKYASKFKKSVILKGVLTIGALELLLWGVGKAFEPIVLVDSKISNFEHILKTLGVMAAGITGMGVLVTALGALNMIPGFTLILAAGAATMAALEELIYCAAKTFLEIAKVADVMDKIKGLSFKDAGDIILDFAKNIGSAFKDALDDMPNPFIMWTFSQAIGSTSVMISKIAKSIAEISSLTIPIYDEKGKKVGVRQLNDQDFKSAAENTKVIISTLGQAIIDTYNAKPEMFEYSLFKPTPFATVVKSVTGMGKMISKIGQSVKDISELVVPTYNEQGKKIGVRSLDKTDFTKAAENISEIITTLGGAVINTYNKDPKMFDDPLFGDNPFTTVVKSATGMAKMISKIGKAVHEIADLRIATKWDAKGNAIEWETMEQKHFDAAANGIESIITTLGGAIIRTYDAAPEMFEDPWFGDNKFAIVVKSTTQLGKMISLIGNGVRDIATLNVATKWDEKGNAIEFRPLDSGDFEKAGNNISQIVSTIGDAIINMYNSRPDLFDSSVKIGLDGPLGFFGIKIPTNAETPFAKVIKACTQMGLMISLISAGVRNFASMRVPIEWDDKGKPTNFRNLTEEDFTQAGENIKRVVTCIGEALTGIHTEKRGLFDIGQDSPITEVSNAVNKTAGTINSIAQVIAYYAIGKFPLVTNKDGKATTELVDVFGGKGVGFDSAKAKIKQVVTFLASVMSELAKDETLTEDQDKVNAVITSVQNMSNAVNNISKTIKDMVTNLNGIYWGGGAKGGIISAEGKLKHFIHTMINLFSEESIKNFELDKDLKDTLDWTNKYISSMLDTISKNIETINTEDVFSNLQDGLNKINCAVSAVILTTQRGVDLTVGDWKTDYLNKIVDVVKKSEEIIDEDRFTQLAKGITELDQAINQIKYSMNFTHQAEDLNNYVEHINSLDVGKMQTFTNMVQALNQLSMRLGDLDHVSDVLANKVSVVLSELTNQIAHAEMTIDNSQKLQSERAKTVDQKIQAIKSIMSQQFVVGVKQITEDQDNNATISNAGDNGGTSIGGGGSENTKYDQSSNDNNTTQKSPEYDKNAKAKKRVKVGNYGDIIRNGNVWGYINLYN